MEPDKLDLKKSGSKQEKASALKEALNRIEQLLNQEDDIPGDNLLSSQERIQQELYAALCDNLPNSEEKIPQELYATPGDNLLNSQEQIPQELYATPGDNLLNSQEWIPQELYATPGDNLLDSQEQILQELYATPCDNLLNSQEQIPQEFYATPCDNLLNSQIPQEFYATPCDNLLNSQERIPQEMCATPCDNLLNSQEQIPQEVYATPCDNLLNSQERIPQELYATPCDNLLNSQEQIPQKLYDLIDIPPGYRFAPKGHELINDYLKKKINNKPGPYSSICSVDVYKYSPQVLTEKYPSLGDGEWYFFSPIERKNPLSNRAKRSAGSGQWKQRYIEKGIYHNNIRIGSRTTLIFYEGKTPNEKKTNWGMEEYMIHQPSRQQNDKLLHSCVLCRIGTI